jgi:hypothetical protein
MPQLNDKNVLSKRDLRAHHTERSVRVYQAFSDAIAAPSLKAGKFVSPFSRNRMTWIKPSFLWMMYRSGWARKIGQTRVLAIDLDPKGFEWFLRNSCLSCFDPNVYSSKSEWKKCKSSSCVTIQWDPDRSLTLEKMDCRTIQIGLKAEALNQYLDKWILRISDVSDLCVTIHRLKLTSRISDALCLLPKETRYEVAPDIGAKIGLSPVPYAPGS